MTKIFRIKNGFLRWMTGLIALSIKGLFEIIKVILVMIAVVVVLAIIIMFILGAGIATRWLLTLIGVSDVKEISAYPLGLAAIFVTSVVYVMVLALSKAKEFGNKYFNSIGNKVETEA